MGADERAVPVERVRSEVGRRWLLGLAGAGSAAAVLSAARPAAAAHEPGDDGALHIGQNNASPVGATTFLGGESSNALVHLDNNDTGDPASALMAFTHGLKTIIGSSDSDHEFGGVGVEGVSTRPDGAYGLGAGFGVQGVSGTGAGVRGVSQSDEPFGFDRGPGIGVLGSAGPGVGVKGTSNASGEDGFGAGDGVGVEGEVGAGVAVRAVASSGRAIEAHGRAAFSTAGNGTIPRSRRQLLVPHPAVTGDSHVTVTFTSDPGAGRIEWIERVSGAGFRIHLAAAIGRTIDFSYLVVEPT